MGGAATVASSSTGISAVLSRECPFSRVMGVLWNEQRSLRQAGPSRERTGPAVGGCASKSRKTGLDSSGRRSALPPSHAEGGRAGPLEESRVEARDLPAQPRPRPVVADHEVRPGLLLPGGDLERLAASELPRPPTALCGARRANAGGGFDEHGHVALLGESRLLE